MTVVTSAFGSTGPGRVALGGTGYRRLRSRPSFGDVTRHRSVLYGLQGETDRSMDSCLARELEGME